MVWISVTSETTSFILPIESSVFIVNIVAIFSHTWSLKEPRTWFLGIRQSPLELIATRNIFQPEPSHI